jgi:hypothetical protein
MLKWMSRLSVVAGLLCAAPASARIYGPSPPEAGADAACDPSGSDPDSIVVCAKRNPGTRYRIPEVLRDMGPIDSAHASRLANERDARSADAYGAQAVGPSGYLQRARQAGCEWRVARQLSQGRQPDCTRKNRKDDPADWQRGTKAHR